MCAETERRGLEIERKYLIRMPDEARLRAMPGAEIWDIEQTYLSDGGDGATRRVRRVRCAGEVKYVHNVKHRITPLSCDEWEKEISREEYDRLMEEADPALHVISKRRYRIPWQGHTLEIDLYDFWRDRATLEIELAREDERVPLPKWVDLVREVTEEAAYKNRALAGKIPMEAL